MKARWMVALIGCVAAMGLAVPAQAAGTVTGTVTIDGDATPVSGVVYFCTVSGSSCSGNNFSNGTFSLTAQDAGPYKLRLQANTLGGATVYYDGTPDGTTSVGSATELDLSVDQGPFAFVLPQIGKLEGTVTDGNGPVANKSVQLTRHGGGSIPSVTTDVNGFYSFGYVLSGGFDVSVGASPNFAGEQAVITMPATGTLTQNLVMKKPAYLQGTITDTISSDPIEYIDVAIYRKISIGCPSACIHRYFYAGSDRTDSDGLYDIGVTLTPGDYIMQRLDAFGGYPVSWSGDQPLQSMATTFTLLPNTSHGNNVQLTPPLVPCTAYDPEANTGPTLCGQVTDASANPLRGVLVSVRPTDGSSPTTVVTDPRGYWALAMPDGEYVIQFRSSDIRRNTESPLTPLGPVFSNGGYVLADAPVVTVADNQQTVDLAGLERTAQIVVGVAGPENTTNISTEWAAYDADTGDLIASDTGTSYLEIGVPPGQSYQLLIWGYDFNTSQPLLPQWVGGNGASRGASTAYSVSEGSVVQGPDMTLPAALALVTKVSIAGKPQVGSTLKAKRGKWNLETGTVFTYEWVRSGSTVGTAKSYVVKRADRGKTLTLKVTGTNGVFTTTVTKKVRIT